MSLAKELKELAEKRKIEIPKEEAEYVIKLVRKYAEQAAGRGKVFFQWDDTNFQESSYIPRNAEVVDMVKEELEKDGFQVIISNRALAVSWGHAK